MYIAFPTSYSDSFTIPMYFLSNKHWKLQLLRLLSDNCLNALISPSQQLCKVTGWPLHRFSIEEAEAHQYWVTLPRPPGPEATTLS